MCKFSSHIQNYVNSVYTRLCEPSSHALSISYDHVCCEFTYMYFGFINIPKYGVVVGKNIEILGF